MPEPAPPAAPSADPLSSLVFCCKCALAALLAYEAHFLLGLHGAPWAPVSAVLVTHPSIHPSLRASFIRVLTNLLGALVGIGVALTVPNHALAIALGVFFTAVLCHLTKLEEGLRSGCVAVLIVLMTRDGDLWTYARDRMASVLVGCLCAILFTFLFDTALRRFLPTPEKAPRPADQHE